MPLYTVQFAEARGQTVQTRIRAEPDADLVQRAVQKILGGDGLLALGAGLGDARAGL